MKTKPDIYGLMAEFDQPEDLVAAAERTRETGYRGVDAYTPFPVHGLDEAIGIRRTRLPWVVLIGGILGGLTGYALQYWISAIDYPLNVGGRPYNSWPAFIPVIFELTVLFASFAAVLGMLGLNGLPQPYHPVFNVPRFELASRTHFFLVIEATDPKFDRAETKQFLESLNPHGVYEVEP